MLRQLRESLRATLTSSPARITEPSRPRRERRPRVEGLEHRALCDAATSTFGGSLGSTSPGTVYSTG